MQASTALSLQGSDSPSPRLTVRGPGSQDSTPAPEARQRQRQAQLAQLEDAWDALTSALQDLGDLGARESTNRVPG